MRKSTISIATLVLAIAFGVSGCGTSTTTSPTSEPTTTSSPATAGDPGSASQQVAASIKDFAFAPDPITLAAGGTITWTNDDTANHTVTFDDPSVTSSDTLGRGATFPATFPAAGTYTYHCSFHPGMQGTVTVS